MQISVYGLGYVGIVSALCFAKLGHKVCCYDIDSSKISLLNQGISPIYEQGLAELLTEQLAANMVAFTEDLDTCVAHAEVHMLAVGTPSTPQGGADVSAVLEIAEKIVRTAAKKCVIVTKSTVPVGTYALIKDIIELNHNNTDFNIMSASNPEFLREGSAIQDFMQPDRVVIGYEDKDALNLLRCVYQPMIEQQVPFMAMDPSSAELTKYAANAFLALKISFINEMSNIAEIFGADIRQIKKALCADHRIDEHFLNPGIGFGGSCLPKDVKALATLATSYHYYPQILPAIMQVNEHQQAVLINKLLDYFDGELANKRIALWGLSFKPNTDDLRDAPSLGLVEKLAKHKVTILAYDPIVSRDTSHGLGFDHLKLCHDKYQALEAADALIIATEWQEFNHPDLAIIKSSLHQPVIFDGRNMFDDKEMQQQGIDYFAMGYGGQWRQVLTS